MSMLFYAIRFYSMVVSLRLFNCILCSSILFLSIPFFFQDYINRPEQWWLQLPDEDTEQERSRVNLLLGVLGAGGSRVSGRQGQPLHSRHCKHMMKGVWRARVTIALQTLQAQVFFSAHYSTQSRCHTRSRTYWLL